MTTMKLGNITNTARAVLMLVITVSVFVALSASASAQVNIRITDANAQSGHTTTTRITIDNMTNFGAATVTLSYDPAVVHITSVAAGDVRTPITNIDNATGAATIAAYVSTVTGPDSPITFANLELLAVGNSGEASPLTLAIITLADADGALVSATPINGTFVVSTGVKGDLNRDGEITPADATITLQLAASGGCDPAADVDGDGKITSLDVLMILQAAAGCVTSSPLQVTGLPASRDAQWRISTGLNSAQSVRTYGFANVSPALSALRDRLCSAHGYLKV